MTTNTLLDYLRSEVDTQLATFEDVGKGTVRFKDILDAVKGIREGTSKDELLPANMDEIRKLEEGLETMLSKHYLESEEPQGNPPYRNVIMIGMTAIHYAQEWIAHEKLQEKKNGQGAQDNGKDEAELEYTPEWLKIIGVPLRAYTESAPKDHDKKTTSIELKLQKGMRYFIGNGKIEVEKGTETIVLPYRRNGNGVATETFSLEFAKRTDNGMVVYMVKDDGGRIKGNYVHAPGLVRDENSCIVIGQRKVDENSDQMVWSSYAFTKRGEETVDKAFFIGTDGRASDLTADHFDINNDGFFYLGPAARINVSGYKLKKSIPVISQGEMQELPLFDEL